MNFKNLFAYIIGYLYVMAFWGMGCNATAQENNRLQTATNWYQKAKFEKAAKAYEKILNDTPNQISASIYYNLGNCYYKLDKIGKSIFYYEKALQIKPNDADTLHNLSLANQKKVDVIKQVPQGFWQSTIDRFFGKSTSNTWANYSIGLMIGFVMCFLIYYHISISVVKRWSLGLAVLCLLCCFLSLCLGYITQQTREKQHYAIITSAATSVTTDPNIQGNVLFELHEGTKVILLQNVNNWCEIKLSDGKIGWVSKEALQAL